MTPTSFPFKAILWDCDGVLMDSEYLACDLSAKTLTAAGYAISTDDFVKRFCGETKRQIHATVNAEAGFDVFARIDNEAKNAAQRALFTEFLQPIQGVTKIVQTLKAQGLSMAVASGSSLERLDFTLQLVGLRDVFAPHIYSAESVVHGKPAPDIFLFAAEKLGVPIGDCLVVEDSLNGVRAGHVAGATVYGFTGGTHVHDKAAYSAELMACGADCVFGEMSELSRFMI